MVSTAKSIEGEEPRRGLRSEYDAYDLALDIPTQVQMLDVALKASRDMSVAEFLIGHPEFRGLVERIRALKDLPYHTVRMNMLDLDFQPVQIMHLFNVAFYGLDKAKDVNERWLRGIIFHGAPALDDVNAGKASLDWMFPVEPKSK